MNATITHAHRRVLAICEMGDVAMSCGFCGHVAGITEFGTSPLGTTLQAGTFQCPKCGKAIRRRAEGCQTFRAANGNCMHIPDRIVIERVPTHL